MAYTEPWMELKGSKIWHLLMKASRNTGLGPYSIELMLGTSSIYLHNYTDENIRKLELMCSPHWRTLLKVMEIRRDE